MEPLCGRRLAVASAILASVGIIVVLTVYVVSVSLTLTQEKKNDEVSIMTWNILAPMWVERQAMRSTGVVDMKLLNDEVRLLMVMDRIMTQQPDILHLQEVQEDIFEKLKDSLYSTYEPVAFAPHNTGYWESYLQPNHTYKSNGVATFYKKDRFHLMSYNDFSTSSDGNVALLTTIKQKECFGVSTAITLVNCHLETGTTAQHSIKRMRQGTTIMNEVEKQIIKNKENDLVVIIAGDLNTQDPYPGYGNFKDRGYRDATEELERTHFPTHYYESPVPVTENYTTDWVSIDHVFIRDVDKTRGKINVLAVEVPSVNTDETTKEYYLKRLKTILSRNVKNSSKDQIRGAVDLLIKQYLSEETASVHDNHANQVLRLGSDHFPMTVKLQIE